MKYQVFKIVIHFYTSTHTTLVHTPPVQTREKMNEVSKIQSKTTSIALESDEQIALALQDNGYRVDEKSSILGVNQVAQMLIYLYMTTNYSKNLFEEMLLEKFKENILITDEVDESVYGNFTFTTSIERNHVLFQVDDGTTVHPYEPPIFFTFNAKTLDVSNATYSTTSSIW